MGRSKRAANLDTDAAVARPLLKWVGGKRQLRDEIRALMPKRFGDYFEPFVGGAALFFDIVADGKARAFVLSDVNSELIDCYTVVRDRVESLIVALQAHAYDRDHYYAVRAQHPATLPPVERAARTIFLNKSGFNGLYRVNASGEFNVPFGKYASPTICDAANLRACARAFANVELRVEDFSRVLGRAKKGDFVYFDPPYVPRNEISFTAYDASGFGLLEHRTLAEVFRQLASRGVYVMLSNSDVPLVHELYDGFDIKIVKAARMVNSNIEQRGRINEVVIRSWCAR